MLSRFAATRQLTEELARPLGPEDQTVQSMPDVSPTKWHRAHTTWFFETFLLEPFEREFAPFRPEYRELFNSYYQGIGPQFTRADRGLLSRPTAGEVGEYRRHVDRRVELLIRDRRPSPTAPRSKGSSSSASTTNSSIRNCC